MILLLAVILLLGVGTAHAQVIGGSCDLVGMVTPDSSAITFECYNLDPDYEVKAVRICPDYIGLWCPWFATTAPFTKAGPALTATIVDGAVAESYFWQITYCAAGESGPGCRATASDAGGAVKGNCGSTRATTDHAGRVWRCGEAGGSTCSWAR